MMFKLVNKSDTYNFTRYLVWPRWYHRAWWRNLWRRITWWRQRVSFVVAVDQECGIVHCASMRWSWRRWRWEQEQS